MKKILITIITVLMLVGCGGDKWPTTGLGSYAPKPQKGKVEINYELDNSFSADINKVSDEYFEEYKELCKNEGFTIEIQEKSKDFEAFNKEGYKIQVSNYDDITVYVYAPKKLNSISWPIIGLANSIPKPDSSLGLIEADRADYFKAFIGEMDIDNYNSYVQQCINKGFNIDYSKDTYQYIAKNKEGYKIYLSYEGFNVISITIEIIEDKTVDNKIDNDEVVSNDTNNGIDPKFKEAMDSYEIFFNEYVDFINKYNESDDTLSLMSEYLDYMSKYSDVMQKMEAIDETELSDEEALYYAEVNLRISKKMLEIK